MNLRTILRCPIILCSLLLVLTLFSSGTAQTADPWLMKGHDTRRTGQSQAYGPKTIDPVQTWSRDVPAANVINIGASVDERGVDFGTWALQHNPEGSNDPRTWDKYDGAVYGYQLNGTPLWGDGRADLDIVNRCYEYEGRERDGNDILFCGLLNYKVTFYNGTVEGQAAIDQERNRMYVGRGDGKLYAIDQGSGEIVWRYATFNPQLEDDPDGGGEIVTSPLYDANGSIYFATWGEGKYETNAIYALNPNGSLRWRYPSNSSLAHRFFASPALSPDGGTIYFSTFIAGENAEMPGVLYAFNELAGNDLPAEDRLKWKLDLSWDGNPIFTNTMAVGSDGTIYVGGWTLREGANIPVVFAVEDNGSSARLKWSQSYTELNDGAQFVLGLALREVGGNTQWLYATTANSGAPLTNWRTEGKLYAINHTTGAVLGSYDPSDDIPGAVGGVNSPAIGGDGIVYIGVRGHFRGPFAPQRAPGYYMGLQYLDAVGRFVLLWGYKTDDNYVEWTHPAIGPDGGIYVGSASHGPIDSVYTALHAPGEVPEGTTPKFYALKGLTLSVGEENAKGKTLNLEAQPNPFSESTIIRYTLPAKGVVRLVLTDAMGREARVIVDSEEERGEHIVLLEKKNLPEGVYFCHLTVGSEGIAPKKIILLN